MNPLRPPVRNETWSDLKQLAAALLLVYPFIGVAAYFARVLIGGRAAVWLGIGLGLVATVAFALVAGFSVIATAVVDAKERGARAPNAGSTAKADEGAA